MKTLRDVAKGAAVIGLLSAMLPAQALAEGLPETWDGLVHVQSKKLKNVYLEPYADFRVYTKVMLVSPEVAFRTNWDERLRLETTRTTTTVSDQQARSMLDAARQGLFEIFARAFQEKGYTVTNVPGPDVLKVSMAIQNLEVNEPQGTLSPRERSITPEAGSARIVVEARDSVSGEILGRAFETQLVGQHQNVYVRTAETNRKAFEDTFTDWAKMTVEGIDELKSLSPIDPQGKLKR